MCAAPKKQIYRISSEGTTFLGEKDNINKLPEEHKEAFLKAAKVASEGQTPPPIKIPPNILIESGFKSETEFLDEHIPLPDLPQPGSKGNPERFKPPAESSFVDILADKIADRILKKLLGG